MEREALTLEALAIAMAARNSGGIVIVQVERIAERGTLNPRQVKIPGILVDCVVVAEKPEYHMQTFASPTARPSPARSRCRCRPSQPDADERAQDHRPPRGARAASPTRGQPRHRHARGRGRGGRRGGIIDLMTLTAEPGVIGGMPAGGLNFGAATNTQAIIDQP
jgi:propionate CoA-transferase